MLIAGVCFSLMVLCIKMLEGEIPVSEIVFFRSFITGISSLIWIKAIKVTPLFGNNRKVLFLRGLFGLIGLSLFYTTVLNMTLATAVVVQYTSPIWTIVLAVFLLKEKVRMWQWGFFLFSFLGIVVMSSGHQEIPWLYVGLGLLSALFSGLAYNMVRILRKTDHPLVIIFYFSLVAMPVTAVWAYFEWVTPVGIQWFYLIAAGVLTQIAQYFMTLSYHSSNMAAVSSIRYLGVGYNLIYDVVIFEVVYTFTALGGIAMVIAGVLANVIYVHRQKRKQPEEQKE